MKTRKILMLILVILLTNCSASRRAAPCRNCPQYSSNDYLLLEYIKLTAYPHEYAAR